ncbi:MAG: hydroxyacid dehydrogenase [Rhodospirillales bacterium]
MPHIVVAGIMHPSGLALLEGAPGFTHDYITSADKTAYLEHLPKADGVVLRTQPLTAEHIASAPNLKIVSRHGVGYDSVDAAALSARNIPLAIVGDVNSRTVAEHAVMMLLAASRILRKTGNALRAGDWDHRNAFESRELYGKTLLIIGFGRIGRRLAALAGAFGMRVLAHDPHISDFEGAEAAPDLSAALAECDMVSIHAPKTGGPLIGAAQIALMKPHAVIVNTSRGGAVDETALAEALQSGRIGAAGIDVFETEPPAADHPLLGLENAIVTPHSAGLTQECAERMAVVSIQNALNHFGGNLDPSLVVNQAGLKPA